MSAQRLADQKPVLCGAPSEKLGCYELSVLPMNEGGIWGALLESIVLCWNTIPARRHLSSPYWFWRVQFHTSLGCGSLSISF
jgi:hypothetical protein